MILVQEGGTRERGSMRDSRGGVGGRGRGGGGSRLIRGRGRGGAGDRDRGDREHPRGRKRGR